MLLVDLQMPGVSGGQLAEKVRALEGPEPLLLAMSATEVQRQQLLAFDGFLLKPLALGDLQQGLETEETWPHRRQCALPIPEGRQRYPPSPPAPSPGHDGDRQAARHDAAGGAARRGCRLHCGHPDLRERAPEPGTGGGHDRRYASTPTASKARLSMIGAAHLARLAAGLEMGGNKEAATPVVLNDLLNACSELERMLLAGKFAST